MLQSTLKAVKTLFSECCVVLSIFLLQRIRQCDVNEVNVFRNCFEGFGKIIVHTLNSVYASMSLVFPVLRSAFVPGLPFQVRYIFPMTKLYLYAAPSSSFPIYTAFLSNVGQGNTILSLILPYSQHPQPASKCVPG